MSDLFQGKTTWQQIIESELEKLYMQELKKFLILERANKRIYPDADDTYRAFQITAFDKVKVIVLAQDPYHNGNADGLILF